MIGREAEERGERAATQKTNKTTKSRRNEGVGTSFRLPVSCATASGIPPGPCGASGSTLRNLPSSSDRQASVAAELSWEGNGSQRGA